MPVMKDIGDRWMTTLYDNFHTTTNIIISWFKDTGIIEVVERETPPELALDPTPLIVALNQN